MKLLTYDEIDLLVDTDTIALMRYAQQVTSMVQDLQEEVKFLIAEIRDLELAVTETERTCNC